MRAGLPTLSCRVAELPGASVPTRSARQMNPPRMTAKRIDPSAYNALSDALAESFWNRKPLERFLRGMLRDVPEVLAGIDFDGLKRETAGMVVERLMENEAKYQGHTIALMLAVARMESFPNLAQQRDGQVL